MCGGTCYWRDEARFLRVELNNESREREETETYVGMLESQKYESDMRLQDAENRLANAHEEIEKLRFELETSYEGYVALDDLYMQRIAEDVDEGQDDAIEALLSEARFRELADNAMQELTELSENERLYDDLNAEVQAATDLISSGIINSVSPGDWVKLPPLPRIHKEAADGDQEVFYSGDWFVFSEYERDRLERALAEKLADVAELTAIRNKMEGK